MSRPTAAARYVAALLDVDPDHVEPYVLHIVHKADLLADRYTLVVGSDSPVVLYLAPRQAHELLALARRDRSWWSRLGRMLP